MVHEVGEDVTRCKPGDSVYSRPGIARMVDGGKLRPLIGAQFGLEDIALAHALSESGRATGEIALHVAAS